MAYDTELADRVRAIIHTMGEVDEKRMMGSLAFLVNGRMAAGVSSTDVFFPMGGGEALELALQRGAHRLRLRSGRDVPFAALTDPDDDTLAEWLADAVSRAVGR
ncbi:MAG: TfoX/Sxy family protein [Microbacterium sp.]